MPGRLSGAWLLAAAVLLGAGLRWAAVDGKQTLSHDEGITYLAATGHLGAFTHLDVTPGSPAGRWAPASEWRALMTCDRFWCFRPIARDLAHDDIHPPLYFWLLHVWLTAAGTGVRAGSAFNAALAVLMIFAVFGFAKRVLGDGRAAGFVALLWAVSPGVVAEPLEARPYGLLAFFALAFIGSLLGVLTAPRAGVRRPVTLALVTAAGALTHFNFALVAAGGALLAAGWAVRHGAAARPRVGAALAAMAAGALLAVAVHPAFWMSIARQRSLAAGYAAGEWPERLGQVASALGGFLVPHRFGRLAVGAAALAVVAGIAVALAGALRARFEARERVVVFFLVWLGAVILGLYLFQVSPPHAMGARYLSVVWPLLACVPVWLSRRLAPAAATGVLAALCLVTAALTSTDLAAGRRALERMPSQRALLAGADRVLVDTIARGVLPRVIPDLPADAAVFAATQERMLREPAAWATEAARGAVYVSSAAYGNDARGREAILALLGAERATAAGEGGVDGLVYVDIAGAAGATDATGPAGATPARGAGRP